MKPNLISALLALFILFIPLAVASPPIINPILSQTINENQTLQFAVTASGSDNATLSYSMINLPQGAIFDPQLHQFTWTPNFNQAGNYQVAVLVSDGILTANQSISITVNNVNRVPSFVPQNMKVVNENDLLQFSVIAIDPDNDVLSYSASNLPQGANFNPSTQQFTWAPSYFQSGLYTVIFSVSDGTANAIQQVIVQVNDVSTAPLITILMPSAVATNYVALNVSTSTNATCKYDTSDIFYDSMQSFSQTNGIFHTKVIANLPDGLTTFYIKCKSAYGDFSSANFILTVASLPSAEITLTPNSPLKPGLIIVNLLTSREMQSAPSLTYFFDDSPETKHLVSLESVDGSLTLWKGYMIIGTFNGLKSGTFEFSGKDVSDIQGNKITIGKTFIVDDEKPSAPLSIKAEPLSNGYIKLSWYYSGENVKRFDVYRSLGSNVDYIDFYANSGNSTFIDSYMVPETTYYYKVSARDDANNVGELSPLASATAITPINATLTPVQATQTTAQKLSYSSMLRINETIKVLDRATLDLQWTASSLETIEDEVQQSLIKKLKLIEEAQNAKSELEGYKSQLKAIKPQDMDESGLEQFFNTINLRLKKINVSIIKSIKIDTEENYVQYLPDEKLQNIINIYLTKYNLTEKEKSAYLERIKNYHANVKITVNAIVASLSSLNNIDTVKTFISKEVYYESPEALQNIAILEYIPKDFADSAQELSIETPDYQIVEQDPMLKWAEARLDYNKFTISYSIDKKIIGDTIKGVTTVALLDPNEFKIKNSNAISAFFTMPSSANIVSGKQFLGILIGLLVVGVLSGYYIILLKKKSKKDKSEDIIFQEEIAKQNIKENMPEELMPLSVEKAQKNPFYLRDGRTLYDAVGLLNAVETMSDEVFDSHVTPYKNDFAKWLRDVFNEIELAQLLEQARTKEKTKDILLRYLSNILINRFQKKYK